MSDNKKDLEGALFDNDRMRDMNSPSRRGWVIVGGKRYWVSSWTKKSAAGETYWTLALTPDNREN